MDASSSQYTNCPLDLLCCGYTWLLEITEILEYFTLTAFLVLQPKGLTHNSCSKPTFLVAFYLFKTRFLLPFSHLFLPFPTFFYLSFSLPQAMNVRIQKVCFSFQFYIILLSLLKTSFVLQCFSYTYFSSLLLQMCKGLYMNLTPGTIHSC